MINLTMVDEVKFDTHKIFKSFYRNNKNACSDYCCFYTIDNKKKPMTFMQVHLIQSRVMKFLYESGWTPKNEGHASHVDLRRSINDFGHKACNPEPLSMDDFFSVTKLLPKK